MSVIPSGIIQVAKKSLREVYAGADTRSVVESAIALYKAYGPRECARKILSAAKGSIAPAVLPYNNTCSDEPTCYIIENTAVMVKWCGTAIQCFSVAGIDFCLPYTTSIEEPEKSKEREEEEVEKKLEEEEIELWAKESGIPKEVLEAIKDTLTGEEI